jgi:release factor glutamine methyltransferase
MTIESANRLLISSLLTVYNEREAASISSLVMERLTGLTKSLRSLHKSDAFGQYQIELFDRYLGELLKSRPVQYVLGEAWFGPYSFYVDEHVLIPRPETEELVDWLLKDNAETGASLSVLDIGTGSGCIPVYIKKKRQAYLVFAMDISEGALEIAKRNSLANNTEVGLLQSDILNENRWGELPVTDLIISNPPYIPEKQKNSLDKHVKDFEPGLALFVPDADPIVFYKRIGEFAMQKMRQGGALFLEIQHDFADNILDWYDKKGFSLELKKDFTGNNRMIKATKR